MRLCLPAILLSPGLAAAEDHAAVARLGEEVVLVTTWHGHLEAWLVPPVGEPRRFAESNDAAVNPAVACADDRCLITWTEPGPEDAACDRGGCVPAPSARARILWASGRVSDVEDLGPGTRTVVAAADRGFVVGIESADATRRERVIRPLYAGDEIPAELVYRGTADGAVGWITQREDRAWVGVLDPSEKLVWSREVEPVGDARKSWVSHRILSGMFRPDLDGSAGPIRVPTNVWKVWAPGTVSLELSGAMLGNASAASASEADTIAQARREGPGGMEDLPLGAAWLVSQREDDGPIQLSGRARLLAAGITGDSPCGSPQSVHVSFDQSSVIDVHLSFADGVAVLRGADGSGDEDGPTGDRSVSGTWKGRCAPKDDAVGAAVVRWDFAPEPAWGRSDPVWAQGLVPF